ncbi:MAG: hypothetical protein E7089_04975 [Bacteroidales bacterium]|nr:hypothetical protein [Bacteroidales bacterium]
MFPITITSCGSDEEDTEITSPGGSDDSGDNNGNNATNEMSPIEQKEFMENVALNFLDEFKARNFESVVDLTEYLSEEYSDYDTDEVDEWLDDYLDAITIFIGTNTNNNYWGYEHYDNYERLYKLSNLKGKFTAKDYKWVYEKSNDLQFIVKDMYGQTCLASLTTSGDVKKVYVGRSEDWNDYYYDGYYYHDYYDVYENTIAVPERMELTFTQGSKTVVKVVVNTDLSSMRGEEFDLSKDSYSVSANVTIDNYEINAEKVAYNAGKDASVSYKIKHNGNNLISITVSADVNVSDEDLNSCKNANVSIDIMGNIQIKGTCNDVIRYCEYLEEADENCENENKFKSCINMANSLLDLGVYYNGKNYKYAQMKMEPAVDKSYYYEEWYCDYVIYFNEDKTTYTLFEVFFNDRNFRSVINKFEDLIESFEDMLN